MSRVHRTIRRTLVPHRSSRRLRGAKCKTPARRATNTHLAEDGFTLPLFCVFSFLDLLVISPLCLVCLQVIIHFASYRITPAIVLILRAGEPLFSRYPEFCVARFVFARARQLRSLCRCLLRWPLNECSGNTSATGRPRRRRNGASSSRTAFVTTCLRSGRPWWSCWGVNCFFMTMKWRGRRQRTKVCATNKSLAEVVYEEGVNYVAGNDRPSAEYLEVSVVFSAPLDRGLVKSRNGSLHILITTTFQGKGVEREHPCDKHAYRSMPWGLACVLRLQGTVCSCSIAHVVPPRPLLLPAKRRTSNTFKSAPLSCAM